MRNILQMATHKRTIIYSIFIICLLFTLILKKNPKYHLQPSKSGNSRILRWVNKRWVMLDNYCSNKHKFRRATLKSPAGDTPIFVHEFNDDAAVSGMLITEGIWDPDNIHLVFHYLLQDPYMAFVDLGAHVGTFSLMAAKLGRNVLAVDPLQENVQRLCNSIQVGNLTKHVIVLFTAVSDSYNIFSFKRDYMNIGGTRLSEKMPSSLLSNETLKNPNVTNTVQLDDLLPLVTFKRAFIKMDVEEHELNVLIGGKTFLDTVDVPHILMEWFWHKKTDGKYGTGIIEFMLSRNYKPFFPSFIPKYELKLEEFRDWPDDVLWNKQ